MRDISQLLMLLALVNAAPESGGRFRKRIESDYLKNISCSLMDHESTAQCFQSEYTLHCRSGYSGNWTKGTRLLYRQITRLTILEWPGECFNIGRLQQYFPELQNLEFINCTKLNTFKGHFDADSKIETITMHGLVSLWEVPADMAAMTSELREMDLRGNGLRHMRAKFLSAPRKLTRILLSDNQWDCSDGGLDWLAMEKDNSIIKQKIVDYNKLMCHQKLYIGKPLHLVLNIIRTVRQTCPVPCACALTHVVSDRPGAVIPIIKVNCSEKHLPLPPHNLPHNSTTLHLEGNMKSFIETHDIIDIDKSKAITENRIKIGPVVLENVAEYGTRIRHNLIGTPTILTAVDPSPAHLQGLNSANITSIRSIIQNPRYRKLADLYLDNNSIPSVKELEGSEWFSTFRVLSLRGNMLRQIPVYAFDKAFQTNKNIINVYLGHNPWRCDCHFIPRFQALLLKYKKVIRDLPDIRCPKSSDKSTSLVQISTMPLGNVCKSGVEMPISKINIVNLILTILILIVVGRFLYDWHSFKTTGKLPWLSTILP